MTLPAFGRRQWGGTYRLCHGQAVGRCVVLNLHKLEVFVMVAREGSFSRAAERLYMTQAAVSQHMRELEASLGTALFVRGRRGVELTAAGERLAAYAERIFALVAEAELVVTDVANLTKGQLTLGATSGVSAYLLPDWAQPFSVRYPQLTVSVLTLPVPKLVEALMHRQIELGIFDSSPQVFDPRIGQVVLEEAELFVVVGRKHPWWGRTQLDIKALDGQAFVARPAGSFARAWMDEALAAHGVHPLVVAEFDAPESVKRAVMAGQSLTILPEYAMRDELELGLLGKIRLTDQPLVRMLTLIWDTAVPLTPLARAFISYFSGRFPQVQRVLQP